MNNQTIKEQLVAELSTLLGDTYRNRVRALIDETIPNRSTAVCEASYAKYGFTDKQKKLIQSVFRVAGLIQAQRELREDSPKLNAPEVISLYMEGTYMLSESPNERFFLLMLNNSLKLVSCTELFVGGTKSSTIDVNRIVREAILSGGTDAVIIHNHPSGSLSPSPQDIKTTDVLQEALSTVGVALADHIIIADFNYRSMRLNKDTTF